MPIVKWPNDDDNEQFGWRFYDTGKEDNITVFELEDDEEMIESSLVGMNGEPIYYHRPSTKQGYIGFVHPDVLEKAQQPKRKRRRKTK